jgi:hypothetical protein
MVTSNTFFWNYDFAFTNLLKMMQKCYMGLESGVGNYFCLWDTLSHYLCLAGQISVRKATLNLKNDHRGPYIAPPALSAPSHGVVSFPGLSHFSESRPLPLLPSSEVNLRWHHRGGRLQHQVKLQHHVNLKRVNQQSFTSNFRFQFIIIKRHVFFNIDKNTVKYARDKSY